MPLTATPSPFSPSGFISFLQSFSCLPLPLHYFLLNKYLALLVSYSTAIPANLPLCTNRLFMTSLLRLTSYHLPSHNLRVLAILKNPQFAETHITYFMPPKSLLSLHRQLSFSLKCILPSIYSFHLINAYSSFKWFTGRLRSLWSLFQHPSRRPIDSSFTTLMNLK